MNDRLMTVGEVAERLRCSRSTVYNLAASGVLRCFRIGAGRGAIRFSEEQVVDFLRKSEQHTVGASEPPPVERASARGFTVLDGSRLKEAWKSRR
jgi:excisionase family DNA binding protein